MTRPPGPGVAPVGHLGAGHHTDSDSVLVAVGAFKLTNPMLSGNYRLFLIPDSGTPPARQGLPPPPPTNENYRPASLEGPSVKIGLYPPSTGAYPPNSGSRVAGR